MYKKIDLTFGQPVFLNEIFNKKHKNVLHSINTEDGDRYSFGISDNILQNSIKALHIKYKNTPITGKRFVLVTNGASQAISAAGYALKMLNQVEVDINKKYWGRIPTLLKAGYHFNGRRSVDLSINPLEIPELSLHSHQFITSPNNPDGELDLVSSEKFTILDSCYNWPQYNRINAQESNIELYALSKLSGHAGARVGWAIIKDEEVYKIMKSYMEESTAGVSGFSQAMASEIIDTLVDNPSILEAAKEELDRRWSITRGMDVHSDNGDFYVANTNGMFLWCKMKDRSIDGVKFLQDNYGILATSGTYFGSTKDYFRINIGCSTNDFQEMVKRFKG